MMASGSSKRRSGSTPVPPVIRQGRGLPWLTIIAVALVVALAGGIAWVVISKHSANTAKVAALAPFTPTVQNRDPSRAISGIYVGAATDNGTDRPFSYPAYKAALHVSADQRVAYDRFPPVGGPHDGQWAACDGVVYTIAVRDENMVHTLEHGAIWIAYNPDTVKGGELDTLKGLVNGQSFISMSPYPGLKTKVSLQAWAHQLQLDSVTDPRIQQFVTALRQNPFVYPETGARCDSPGWDSANPPAFDASPRSSSDVQMDGKGAAAATGEPGAAATGSAGAESGAGGAPATGSGAVQPSASETGPVQPSTSGSAGGAPAATGSGAAQPSASETGPVQPSTSGSAGGPPTGTTPPGGSDAAGSTAAGSTAAGSTAAGSPGAGSSTGGSGTP